MPDPARDGLGVSVGLDEVVVTHVGKELQALGLRCRFVERSTVGGRHDLVALAVQDEQRCLQVADASQARVGVRDQRLGDERVVVAGHVANAGEGRLQHQPARRVLQGQRDRHPAAERLAHDDRLLSGFVEQRLAGRPGVRHRALLAGLAGAAAVAAVVEQQDVEAGPAEQLRVADPVPHVAAVAVAEEDRPEPLGGGLHPPAVEALAVLGPEAQLVVAEAAISRRLEQLALGEVQQRVEQPAPHGGHSRVAPAARG